MKDFEVPSFWINKVLSLVAADYSTLRDAVVESKAVLEAVDTTLYIGTGYNTFECLQEPMMDRSQHDSITMEELKEIRELMLLELFTHGLIIQQTVGHRQRVARDGDTFMIIREHIGQYSEMCWIDQRDTIYIPVTMPVRVLEELAERHVKWSNWK